MKAPAPALAAKPKRLRAYDKGERRRKHVARGKDPQLVFDSGNPRKVIGKCPSDITDEARDGLLERAVPLPNIDRELPVPKKVYAVYQGAIYEAQTSDRGRTYHAYPFKGKLGDGIIDLLRDMAREDDCLEAFESWNKKYITRHGK